MSPDLGSRTEPIALVGIGCRMSGGVAAPAPLWRMLLCGADVRELTLSDLTATFDTPFLGAADRVDTGNDPQRELLLRLCWEALEDAGIVPDALSGARLGMFIGHARATTSDTACSSSLVAVDRARRSLLLGHSDIALVVGGGAGVLVLKPLRAARRDNDRAYALVTESSVVSTSCVPQVDTTGFDGHPTAAREPSVEFMTVSPEFETGGKAVTRFLETALRRWSRDAELDFVDSHGIEPGSSREWSGMLGLIKAALSVCHRQSPPPILFTERSPALSVDFRWQPTQAPAHGPRRSANSRRAVATVSSSRPGESAFVVLEQPPELPRARIDSFEDVPVLLTLSASSPDALALLMREHLRRLESGQVDVEELGAALALRRTHHTHRLALVAANAEEAAAKLRGHLRGDTGIGVAEGQASAVGGKIAFLFGDHWPPGCSTGRTLMRSSTVFRAKVVECDAVARGHLGWSILDALTARELTSTPVPTRSRQPIVFAVQLALAQLWKSWGIVPDGVLGHGVGEIAAAHVSDTVALDSALAAITGRAAVRGVVAPSCGRGDPVSGASAIHAMIADGFDTFIELTHDPVLSISVAETIAESGSPARVITSLGHDADDWRDFFAAVGDLHVGGRGVKWKRRYPDGANVVDLPLTPWIDESTAARISGTLVPSHDDPAVDDLPCRVAH